MKELSDNELMLLVAAGETEHVGLLYERWRRRIAALCYSMVGNSSDAADLSQDVFLRLLRYRRSFRGESSFGTWLYTLARRQCLDRLQHEKRQRELGEDLQLNSGQRIPTNQDRVQRLKRAFESLEPEQRELLAMHRVQGWKFREIAELWNMSEGSLKTRSHRAIKELRTRFHQLERQEHEL